VDLFTILQRLETYSILGKAVGRVYQTLEPFETNPTAIVSR
jgi:hypothetical protein